ncbi:MAG TPA: hypothetical protein VGD26_02610 [Chitinophagaceae bacterium]
MADMTPLPKRPAYLAIDPGDTSGWATFDWQGNLIGMGQVKEADFVEKFTDLLTSDLQHVIIEDYVLFQHKAMAQTNARGRKLKTAKMVGQLEMLANLRDVPYTKQESGRYRIGAMWGGFEIPSNHSISHQYVAAAHGIFWLQSNGIRKPGQFMKESLG